MDTISSCFARGETRATAAVMITGLLGQLDTRNCWTPAQQAGQPGPHRLHHLLSRGKFDHDQARENIARLVVRELAGQDVVLVADETGDAKSSVTCVGAARQYSGALGGVGLCQVSVHLVAVTDTARVPLDRALYLGQDWAAGEERRDLAGVPEEVMFATKPEQAVTMVRDALQLGLNASWFAGDEAYSGRRHRRSYRELGLCYAVAVKTDHVITDGSGKRWEARHAINKVGPEQWQRMRTGHGSKGTREYDWAWTDVRADDTPEGHEDGKSVLVARRHRYTGEVSFFRCWTPGNVSLAKLVEVITRRWRIEETFQLSKGFTGLDEGQVTCWNSWMRWSLFSMIATVVLALTLAESMAGAGTPATVAGITLVPLSSPELVRILRDFVLPEQPRDQAYKRWWRTWRRRHQAIARHYHRLRHEYQGHP